MEPDQFDALTRSVPAAGSRRRALVAALGGSLAVLVGGRSSSEAGKKKGTKKRPCPRCAPDPAATVCPPRDPCPARSCCYCQAPSPTLGCRLGAPVSSSAGSDALVATCDEACGGPGTSGSGQRFPSSDTPNTTWACLGDGVTCVSVECPV